MTFRERYDAIKKQKLNEALDKKDIEKLANSTKIVFPKISKEDLDELPENLLSEVRKIDGPDNLDNKKKLEKELDKLDSKKDIRIDLKKLVQPYWHNDTKKKNWNKFSDIEKIEDIDPIQVLKIKERYFILDGNHRAAVAKLLEFPKIRADVYEIT